MKKKVWGVFGGIAVIILAATSMVVTKENEYSLIRRFGKVDRIIEQSGLDL